jgi:hypothetical protein
MMLQRQLIWSQNNRWYDPLTDFLDPSICLAVFSIKTCPWLLPLLSSPFYGSCFCRTKSQSELEAVDSVRTCSDVMLDRTYEYGVFVSLHLSPRSKRDLDSFFSFGPMNCVSRHVMCLHSQDVCCVCKMFYTKVSFSLSLSLSLSFSVMCVIL